MLGLAVAASNVPYMFRPVSSWQAIYQTQTTEGIPPPNELADETDQTAQQHADRIQAGFTALRGQLQSYRPDVVVVLGYDDGTCFTTVQVPQLCTYTAPEITGSAAVLELGENPQDHMVTFRCNPEFAWEMHRELVDREFDLNYMAVQHPLGRPEMGTSSAFTRPLQELLGGVEATVVPFFINCHVEPTPTGHRLLQFGTALGEILEDMPGRVALIAVGGLSHDPKGDRAGWIDNRLDQWVLGRLQKGDASRLNTLYDVDSDTVRGGTGQIRTWLAMAAAMERVHRLRTIDQYGHMKTMTTAKGERLRDVPATVVDYIPSLRTMTGIAFAYYNLG
jgi:protocatechuate 4,5-dioxygenase beta chain